jgi:hypothetical protein
MPNKNFTNFTESTTPAADDFFVGYLASGAVNSESRIKYSNLGTSTNTANRLVLRNTQGSFNANVVTLNQIYANDPANTPIILGGYTSINTATKLDVLTINGPVYIEAGTSNYLSSAVSETNRTNTYITLGTGGSSNDWAYIRQIGGANGFTLSIDLHDDANGSSGQGFAIRNVASSASEPDPAPVTNFYISPAGNTEIRNNLTVNTSLTDQSALFISDQGGIHDLRNGYMNICFTEGIRLWSGKLSPTPISNTLSFFKDGSILANGGVTASRIDATNLVGMISYFAHSNTGPAGWQECNGAAIPTGTDYLPFAALRAFLINGGSVYGTENGNPQIPDLRGRFIRSSNGDSVRDFQEMNITTVLGSNIAILNNIPFLADINDTATNIINTDWYKQIIVGSTLFGYPVSNIGGLEGATITAIDVPNRRVTLNRNATSAATGGVLANRPIGSFQDTSIPHHRHGYAYSNVSGGFSWTSPSYAEGNFLNNIAGGGGANRFALKSFDVGSLTSSGSPSISVGGLGNAYESRPVNINFKAYIKL